MAPYLIVPRVSALAFKRGLQYATRPRHVKLLSMPNHTALAYRRRPFSTFSAWYANTDVTVPPMAESISEGTLSAFTKQVGDYVEQDEEIASIETDKIDVSVVAPEAGTIKELTVSEGDTVTVGQKIAVIEPGSGEKDGGSGKSEGDSGKKEGDSGKSEGGAGAAQTKPTRSAAETPNKPKDEHKQTGVTQERTSTTEHVKPTEERSAQPKREGRQGDHPEQTTKAEHTDRAERRVKMNRMRLRIAERLKQSQNTAASLTTFNEVDMTAIMELRKKHKDDILKNHGVKLGFMSAFSKAATLAMKEVPAVNASIEGPNGGDTIVYRDYVDISVAVATPKGLVTPVVRNAESMSMIEIEREIASLGAKARDGKLTIEDMAGGSFTISNGGVFGSMMGTPIINLPQTAVLGLHAIKDRPMVVNGKIEIRPMMYLALTYDHRLLDGREAVTFLVLIQKYLQDPASMLLT
ncbi:hypothetical protein R6Q59_010178 [Mikania micrantha]